MEFTSPIKNKKAVVFGFDQVLYPEKDYLLQVYYLFAEFLAYVEQFDAAAITAFMQQEYLQKGTLNLFEKTAAHFSIPGKYQENFLLLHQTARLPLKLLLYQQALNMLQACVASQKDIFLLIDGNPAEQLNKMKQLEWHGLENYLKVYFVDEFEDKPSPRSLTFILKQHQLNSFEVLLVGSSELDEKFAKICEVDFFDMNKVL